MPAWEIFIVDPFSLLIDMHLAILIAEGERLYFFQIAKLTGSHSVQWRPFAVHLHPVRCSRNPGSFSGFHAGKWWRESPR
jgi:hypothetical protein